jgi:hypothetical protein
VPGLFDDDHAAVGGDGLEQMQPERSNPAESARSVEAAAGEQASEPAVSFPFDLVAPDELLPSVVDNALIVQEVLQDTSAMLTHFGLTALHENAFEREYAVLLFNSTSVPS